MSSIRYGGELQSAEMKVLRLRDLCAALEKDLDPKCVDLIDVDDVVFDCIARLERMRQDRDQLTEEVRDFDPASWIFDDRRTAIA